MRSALLALCILLFATAVQAGAWGSGSFENDDALDWVVICTKTSGFTVVKATLERANAAEQIEADAGAAAIAAAEVVAAAKGKPLSGMPSELRSWIERQPKEQLSQLAPLAKAALARVKDPKVSELRQLWSEGKPAGWLSEVASLEARLAH